MPTSWRILSLRIIKHEIFSPLYHFSWFWNKLAVQTVLFFFSVNAFICMHSKQMAVWSALTGFTLHSSGGRVWLLDPVRRLNAVISTVSGNWNSILLCNVHILSNILYIKFNFCPFPRYIEYQRPKFLQLFDILLIYGAESLNSGGKSCDHKGPSSMIWAWGKWPDSSSMRTILQLFSFSMTFF